MQAQGHSSDNNNLAGMRGPTAAEHAGGAGAGAGAGGGDGGLVAALRRVAGEAGKLSRVKLPGNPMRFVMQTSAVIDLADLRELQAHLALARCTAHMNLSFGDTTAAAALTLHVMDAPLVQPGVSVGHGVVAHASFEDAKRNVLTHPRYRAVTTQRGVDDWMRLLLHWAFVSPSVSDRAISVSAKRPRDSGEGGGTLLLKGARHLSLDPSAIPPPPPAAIDKVQIRVDGSVVVRVAALVDDGDRGGDRMGGGSMRGRGEGGFD